MLEEEGLVHDVDSHLFKFCHKGIHDGIVMTIRQGHKELYSLPVRNEDASFIEDFFCYLANHGDFADPFIFEGAEDFPNFADIDCIKDVGFLWEIFMGFGHKGDSDGAVACLFGAAYDVNGQVSYASKDA